MAVADECISSIRGVLAEVPQPQKLFSSLTQASKESEEQLSLKLKYAKDESEYTKLKMAFTQIETKSKMIDNLVNTAPDQWPSVEKNDNKENFDRVKDDLKKAKRESEHMEERLTDLIENAQEKIEELEEKKKEAENAIASVEQKKAKLESLRAARVKGLAGLDGVDGEEGDLGVKVQQQKEALKTTELALQRCDLVLSEHQRAVSRLSEDCCLARALNGECRDLVAALKAQREGQEVEAAQEHQWLEQSLSSLRQILGVSNIRMTGQTVTLDLTAPGPTSPVRAELKMVFSSPKRRSDECLLVAAELSQDVLECRDVVAEAVTSNDPVLLITEVKRRLSSHAPVLQEVDQLRNHYAIDYVHDQRILRVMLGSSGQIVCTLAIDNGYPARGAVRLSKIEGNGHHKTLDEYKPPMDNPTMTDWLQYLQAQL